MSITNPLQTLALIGAGVVAGIGLSRFFQNKTRGKHEEPRPREHKHAQLTVLNSKAITALMSVIREKSTPGDKFVLYADRLLRILAEEALANLPIVREVDIVTPCGPTRGLQLPASDALCAVSIMRSGDVLLEQIRKLSPGIAIGKILIQRDEHDPLKRAKLFYSKLPADITKRFVLLVDPMLGTGGSAISAINAMERAGVNPAQIMFVTVLSAPEGIEAVAKAYPQVKILTASLDEYLTDTKFIFPGLGDFGDRYYQTI